MKLLFSLLLILFYSNTPTQENSRELILSGVDAMFEKNHVLSLELLTKAKTIASENNNKEDLFLAINNIGANYYAMLDYGEALNNYLEAYNIAINELDSSHEMSVLNNIAILYSKENNYKQAERYFLNAYDIAKKERIMNKKALYAINLGEVYNKTGNLDKASKYLNEAINLLQDERLKNDALLNLSQNYLLQNKFNEAKEMSLLLMSEFNTSEFENQRIANYLILSEVSRSENAYDVAVNYALTGMDATLNEENKIDIYKQLSEIYLDQGLMSKVIEVKDSLIVAYNDLNEKKSGRLFETNKVKFEIKNYQRELENRNSTIITQQKRFYLLLSASVFIILIVGWALRNSYVNIKQKKILHRRTEEIILLELDKEKTKKLLLEKQLQEKETLSLLQQEQLKSEIEGKNRKLSAKALFLSDRNVMVSSIIEDLEKIKHQTKQPGLQEHIYKLKGILRTDNEWESFVHHFEEVNQGFLSNLKRDHSTLNTNDIRFLSYVYMNLSMKEIASIFNITPEACRKRKERVSKKLGLPESTRLHSYLYEV